MELKIICFNGINGNAVINHLFQWNLKWKYLMRFQTKYFDTI